MSNRILYTPRERRGAKKNTAGAFWTGAIILLITAFFVGGVYLSRLPAWQVNKVEITGEETLHPEELKVKVRQAVSGNFALLFPRASFPLINKSKLASLLKKEFPKIAEVEIEKEFPDQILITVRERKIWGILCNDLHEARQVTRCAYVDTYGFGIEEAPDTVGSLILKIKTDFKEILPGSQILDPELAQKMMLLEEQTQKSARAGAIGFSYAENNPKEVVLETDEIFRLIFLLEGDLNNTFEVLKRVLEEEIKEKRSRLDYIDLRFGNKVFYKFRAQF